MSRLSALGVLLLQTCAAAQRYDIQENNAEQCLSYYLVENKIQLFVQGFIFSQSLTVYVKLGTFD